MRFLEDGLRYALLSTLTISCWSSTNVFESTRRTSSVSYDIHSHQGQNFTQEKEKKKRYQKTWNFLNHSNVYVSRRTSTVEQLNSLLGDLEVKIVDVVLPLAETLTDIVVTLSNLRFKKFFLNDIYCVQNSDFFVGIAEETHRFNLKVDGLKTYWTGDYTINFFDSGLLEFIKLNGYFKMNLEDIALDVSMTFFSEDFDKYLPSRVKLVGDPDSCFKKTAVDLSTLSFDGFLLDSLDSIVLDFFPGLIEDAMRRTLCTQIQNGIQLLSVGLGNVTELYESLKHENVEQKSQSDIDDEFAIPQFEATFLENKDEIVDFSNTSQPVGNVLRIVGDIIDTYVANEVVDSDTGTKDLGINVLLRSLVLDENTDEFVFAPDFSFDYNLLGIDLTIALKEIATVGIDRFSLFTPLRANGNTLGFEYELPNLSMALKFNVTVWSESEAGPDDVFAFTLGNKHSEEFTLELFFEEIYANVTASLLVDLKKLENAPLGSFFNVSNILPCTFASLNFFEIKELLPYVKINAPNVQDLFDTRVGEIVSELFVLMTEMSSGVISHDLPEISNTFVRNAMNTVAQDALTNVTAVKCPLFTSSEEALLDYRDLLLDPEDAISKGGTGTSPYGDIFAFVKGAIEDNFVSEDDDGNPKFNTILGSITEGNSGEVGLFQFSPSFRCNQDILGALIGFEVKDFSVRNMDNVLYPFEIFQPTGPYVARSRMTVGTPSRPLKIDMEFAFLSTKNGVVSEDHFKVILAFPRIAAVVSILSMVKEEEFMQFPLINLPIMNCWLALFQTMDDRTPGIQLEELDIQTEVEEFSFECVTCSRLSSLRDLLGLLKNPKVFSVVLRMLLYAGTQYLKLDFLDQFNDMIVDSSRSCPSHVNYNPAFSNETIVVLDALAENLTVVLNQNENIEVDQQLCLGGGSNINIPLPKGPYERPFIESLIFSGIFVGVMSKGLAPIFFSYIDSVDSWEPSDPLLTQKNLTQEQGDKFMDISDLNSTFLSYVAGPMEMANASVSGMVDDPINGGTDIGANVMIKRFLNEQSVLSIPLRFNLLDIFVVESLEISGLDTFTMLNAVDFIGPQTFRSRFELSFIKVKINGAVIFLEGANENNTLNETMSVSMGFHNIKFDVAVLLGIVEESFKNIRVGSLLFIDQIMSCFLSVVEKVSVTRLISSIARFDELYIEGFFADDLRSILMSLDKDITSMFGEDLVKTMPGLLDGVFRPFLNNFIAGYLQDIKCMFSPPGGQFIDLRDLLLVPEMSKEKGGSGEMPYGNLISTLYGIASNNFFDEGENGFVKINNQIRSFTQEGTVEFPNPVLDLAVDLKEALRFRGGGNVVLRALYDTKVSGLDSILHPLVVFYPEDAYVTDNLVRMGTISKPLILSSSFYVELDSGGVVTSNEVRVKIMLTGVGIQGLLNSYMSKEFLMNFPLVDVSNYNCWFALFPPVALDKYGINDGNGISSLSIKDANVFMDNLILDLECFDCSDGDFKKVINDFASEDLENAIMNLLTSDYLQMYIDRAVFNGMLQCPHQFEFTGSAGNFSNLSNLVERGSGGELMDTFMYLFSSLASFMLFMIIVSIILKRAAKRRHVKWLLSLEDADLLLLYTEYIKEERQNKFISENSVAMVVNPDVPSILRVIVPLVVILNCGLFLSGHINLGASIDATFTFAGERYVIYGVYNYSIIKLIEDMWKFASKGLAVVVFFCSAIWPYLKQFISLVLWMMPPNYISCQTRGSIYRKLDLLAKWSMIDIFLIVMAMAIFRIDIRSPPRYPDDYLGLDMMMFPRWGLYSNALAQIVSQLTSHWIIYYHDKIVSNALLKFNDGLQCPESVGTESVESEDKKKWAMTSTKEKEKHQFKDAKYIYEKTDGDLPDEVDCLMDQVEVVEIKESLCDHKFVLGGLKRGFKMKVSLIGNIVFGIACFLTCVFILCGSLSRYLVIEIEGLVAGAIVLGQDGKSADMYHNVFTMSSQLVEIGTFVGSVKGITGTTFLAIIVVTTCFCVPLAQAIIATVLWFAPLRQCVRERLSLTLEVLKAWQYIEVFFLGTVIMMWQSEKISYILTWIVCNNFYDIFDTLAFHNILDPDDAQCMMIYAKLGKGVAFHIIACLLLWWITYFVQSALEQHSTDISLEWAVVDDKVSTESSSGVSVSINLSDIREKELKALRTAPPVKFTDEYVWFFAKPIRSSGSNGVFKSRSSYDSSSQ